ncbi:unnamed protein product [Mesocestoides corti]|uniref:Annexin n=1 Tax=Mesocestoides corti TaxID=53468 RepID=A0A0R3UEY3_MESCO|nr:unnamed protein product [Mesocestoides corti]
MSVKCDVNGKPCNPTLKPYPGFNPASDVELLKKAMDGLGTDEAMIIEVLGNRTSNQRIQIAEAYKASYGEDLRERLQGELSGDFGELVDLMFFTIPQLKAYICYKAIKGAGTDELALIEVICTSTNAEIQELKSEYARSTENSLEEDVAGDTSGYFKRILIALLAAQRPEPTEQQLRDIMNKGIEGLVDRRAAEADAQKLYDAGEKKLGTDEETFINILCTRSAWQIQAINKAYEKISKKRLIEAIASETSGDFKRALTTTLLANINPAMAFAEHLRKAIRGAGTNDDELMRIIVWRSEIDMKEIKNCYLTRYNKDLVEDVKNDTSGDYEKLLVRLLGGH